MDFTRDQVSKIKNVGRKFALDFIVLFGSRAKGSAIAGSDIDFGVHRNVRRIGFSETVDLYRELSFILGDNVDIADLASAGPLLRYEVAHDGQVVYRRNKRLYSEFVIKACRDYYDFEPYFKLEENSVKKSLGYFHKQYAQ